MYRAGPRAARPHPSRAQPRPHTRRGRLPIRGGQGWVRGMGMKGGGDGDECWEGMGDGIGAAGDLKGRRWSRLAGPCGPTIARRRRRRRGSEPASHAVSWSPDSGPPPGPAPGRVRARVRLLGPGRKGQPGARHRPEMAHPIDPEPEPGPVPSPARSRTRAGSVQAESEIRARSEGDLGGLPDGGGGVDAARGRAGEEGVVDDGAQLLGHHGAFHTQDSAALVEEDQRRQRRHLHL
mmetsp:Transcript_57598/g.120425  ORF Transcript_57598/g.120425 Transcript_57598/m.120425 type:complete len:236 (-) Transcript_57598:419-1126(-)